MYVVETVKKESQFADRMFTFIFVYQLWHFHSNFINVYSKVSNLQRILVPIMTFVEESKKGTDHSSYANSDVCMCHPALMS